MRNISFILLLAIAFTATQCSKESVSNIAPNTSTSGSQARFTVAGNYLYVINQQNLKSFDITNPADPKLKSEISVGPDIETIYPFKNNLFIGSNTAMYVYSLSKPEKPEPASIVSYVIRGRDPVVANDTVAFSTLRNFNGVAGVLSIMDIKTLSNIFITGSIVMEEPYGLGLSDSILYVCEGTRGLKVFNIKGLGRAANNAPVKLVNNGDVFYDVIPRQDILYAYMKGGFSTFNISNKQNPVLLARVTQ